MKQTVSIFVAAAIGAVISGQVAAATLDPLELSGSIHRGEFTGYYKSVFDPLEGSLSYSDEDGFASRISFDSVRGIVSVTATDPYHTPTELPFGSTIFSDALLTYQIKFDGAPGIVAVQVQGRGSRFGLGSSTLAIYDHTLDEDFFNAAPVTTTPPFSSSFDTNNATLYFQAGNVYDVTLVATLIGSGSAYVDPTFKILTQGYSLSASQGLQLSPVPLPASAPMFGTALLVLGAIGYGVKRKKADVAAA